MKQTDKPKSFIKKVFGLKKRYETKNAKGKSKKLHLEILPEEARKELIDR